MWPRHLESAVIPAIDIETVRRAKRKVLIRILFQLLLFCLASWLLISGSPTMDSIRQAPPLVKLWIAAVGLCVVVWRVVRTKHVLRQLKETAQSSALS
jgi:hypothetical protein